MAAPVMVAFPAQVDIDANYTVRFTALSPTDGSVVAGVKISNASILASPVSAASPPDGTPAPGADVAPLFVPIPASELG